MSSLSYVKHEKIVLKDHPDFPERWVQERIAADPAILGLGELLLKDTERIQPHAGRLDLLLQDPDTARRYEVELQLGSTDETHIIRTLEYWDIERKRYPQYEHVAVLVAEDITSRFLNVISLFNGVIPLVAIQLNAIKVGASIALVFTTVLNEVPLGLVEDDEVGQVPANRAYWEDRASPLSLGLVDQLLEVIRTIDPQVALKYNRHYIGLATHEQPNNFAMFQPLRGSLRLGLTLRKSDEIQAVITEAGLDLMRYDSRRRRYLLRIGPTGGSAARLTVVLAGESPVGAIPHLAP